MLPVAIASIILFSLILYALLGGADFGAGVWDLLASGPRKEKQRVLIGEAITPVWEANHVWLILSLVVLFTGFPKAFGWIGIALHIPLTLMLIGIIVRGSAFIFRHYDLNPQRLKRHETLFAAASSLTPVFLGVSIGAVTDGKIHCLDGKWNLFAWLEPFPLTIGIFTLVTFAFLAAVYLIKETNDRALQEDFRYRSLVSQTAVILFALLGLFLSPIRFRSNFIYSTWSCPLLVIQLGAMVGAVTTLLRRQYSLAKLFAIAEVSILILGWGFAQYPYLVAPELTIYQAATEQSTLLALLFALMAGSIVLFPSLYWLFRIFKSH